jgi:hypothetical protein
MLTGRPREVLTIRTAKALGAVLEREDFGAALEREEEKNEVDGDFAHRKMSGASDVQVAPRQATLSLLYLFGRFLPD